MPEPTITPEGAPEGAGGGGEVKSFFESLPEDLAKEAAMAKFVGKTPEDLARSYVNLERGFGGRIPAQPKPGAPRAEWDAWNKEYNNGYPKEASEYTLRNPEAPEGYEISEQEQTDFRDFAHKNGLTQAQADKIWQSRHQKRIEQFSKFKEESKKTITQDKARLKKEWGDSFKERVTRASSLIKRFGSEELKKQVFKDKTHVPADLMLMLDNMATQFQEGKIEKNSVPKTAPSRNEVLAKIEELRKDRNYQNGDPKLVAQMETLYKKAYPSKRR